MPSSGITYFIQFEAKPSGTKLLKLLKVPYSRIMSILIDCGPCLVNY